MHTSGDEMELYAAVNRKFRHIFNKQEQMKTFKVYDALEVNSYNICNQSIKPINKLNYFIF